MPLCLARGSGIIVVMTRHYALVALLMCAPIVTIAQSPEFTEPWKNPNIALAIDPFEGNPIDWEQLATDRRVVAIIHRATIGFRVDTKYAERKVEAKKRGYKWGALAAWRPTPPTPGERPPSLGQV